MSRFLLLLLCILNILHAQYVLDETGVMLGGGLSPSSAPIGTGTGGNLTFFWTHFNCGKAYGYHVTGGFRYLGYSFETDTVPASVSLTDGALTIGAAFKFRMKNFHRKTETAFLIGPGLTYHLNDGLYNQPGTDLGITPFVTEAQFAIWWKKDLSKHRSLFISPGANIPLGTVFSISGQENRSPAYVYLSAGFSWWNNK